LFTFFRHDIVVWHSVKSGHRWLLRTTQPTMPSRSLNEYQPRYEVLIYGDTYSLA